MNVNLIKVEKGELLAIDNYEAVIAKYSHLKGVKVRDLDTKPQLPVHVVLGAGKYARIKTGTRPHVGREEPGCCTHQTRVVRDVPWTGVWSDSDDANLDVPTGIWGILPNGRTRANSQHSTLWSVSHV